MKILMICTEKLPVPPVLGGAIQTYLAGILPYLSKHHTITVLGTDDPTLPNEETINGVKYVRVPGKALEIYQDGVVEYIQNNEFDLIHVFNRPRLILPIREVAQKAKITLSMHNDMFTPEKIDPEEARRALQEISQIVTVSDYIGNGIKELYPESSGKIKTIYSGVDIDRFRLDRKTREDIRREHGLENKTVLLFAGRLSRNKGADKLVRAMPELAKRFDNLALVLMGSKWFSQDDITDYVAYVRALSKKVPVPVIATGFVSPDKIHNWFGAADLFVCTSQWQEPLARVHYEAMAAGLPIVTTARGGNPEVIIPGENGLVVENPEDPNGFVENITKILSNKSLMNNMGKKGRELAISNYTWDRVASEVLGVWDKAQKQSLQSESAIQIAQHDLQQEEVHTLQHELQQEEVHTEKQAQLQEVEKQPVESTDESKKILETVPQKEVAQKESENDQVERTEVDPREQRSNNRRERLLELLMSMNHGNVDKKIVPMFDPSALARNKGTRNIPTSNKKEKLTKLLQSMNQMNLNRVTRTLPENKRNIPQIDLGKILKTVGTKEKSVDTKKERLMELLMSINEFSAEQRKRK